MAPPRKPVRVLIVDDSASVRQTLAAVLASDPDIDVLGIASDPFIAAARIRDEIPDVITLDVEMPRMDGITFLRKLMAQHPIPVVMCSSLVEAGSETLMQALEAGAVDIILKPKVGVTDHLTEAREHICEVVKGAAQARVGRSREHTAPRPPGPERKLTADAMLPPAATGHPKAAAMARTTETIICIGASTGGTESLREVLEVLPADAPGIVVVQHMPERFTAAFARRLDSLCEMEVKEAADGDVVLRGRVLVAPGNLHTMIERSGARYFVSVKEGPLVTRHRPSVDVLFRSAARSVGANAVGVIMTGMGDDGARGMAEMRNAGAFTLAQDEATSIVFGMPKEAIAHGGVEKIVPLHKLAQEILRAAAR
jgi:two-component system chemotaxis response regulator CheB